jgi:hypothetical protein
MKFLLALLFCFTSTAFAFCEPYTRFGTPINICFKKELNAYVNDKCEEDCLAVKFLKSHHPKSTHRNISGGKNPAAEACKYYGIKVIVLKDPRRGEQSFCEFSDGSLVDSNAIQRSLR